ALARDPSMDVHSVLFQQPRTGRLSDEQLQKIGHPALKLPDGPDALAAFDCIILGDVTADQLSAEDRTRLEKFVSERGGTLVVLAGKRAMPFAYTGPGSDAADPLRKLLPVEATKEVRSGEDGFAVAL